MDTNKIEVAARTEEAAIAEALAALSATRDEVKITILNHGTKGGLFGIGAKPVRILVVKKSEPADVATNFLRDVTLAMGLGVNIETQTKDRQLIITMSGDNMGLLIGKRGHTLDAMQYLTNLAVNQASESNISVILDTENYRKRRRETLESLAYGIARKVKSTRKPVTLEPMSRFERHVIHTALQGDRYVRTSSEGGEPYRYVVVSLK
ncbi:MAG: protein jag [Defluviitaleaceae bacterium]|nr:protein jag [Defluviitaleaceae bacterium]